MVCCMRVGTRTKVTDDELQLGLICSPFGPILFTKFWRASVDRRKNVVIGGAWDLWLTTTPESTKGALVLTHVSHHCTYNVSIFLLILFLFNILIEVFIYSVNELQMFVLITFSNTLILKMWQRSKYMLFSIQ